MRCELLGSKKKKKKKKKKKNQKKNHCGTRFSTSEKLKSIFLAA
jgi:hypothetical protein